jgi:dolichol kinase
VTAIRRSSRADLVSAWGIGVGIGLIALQLTWLIGARLASVFWDPPVGPTVAFVLACLIGIVVAAVAGRRLARKTRTESVVG